MSLKIPPPIIFLLHMFLVWLVARYLPEASFEIPAQRALVQVLGVAGASITILAMGLFRRAGTTVDPLKPERASKIVDTGIFRFTRNPMYLGLAFVLLAWIIWKGNALGIVFLITCLWYITKFQIIPEEKVLEEKFGNDYLAYKTRVRRWI